MVGEVRIVGNSGNLDQAGEVRKVMWSDIDHQVSFCPSH